MTPDDIAEAIIRHFEKCHLKMYYCPSKKATIGVGHVIRLPQEKHLMTATITEDEAERIFEKDYNAVARTIDVLTKPELNGNQYAALVSLVFNIGEGNFKESTLLRLMNSPNPNWKAIELQFHRWVRGDKRDPKTREKEILPGLVRRRNCEAFIFGGGTIDQLAKVHNWYQ